VRRRRRPLCGPHWSTRSPARRPLFSITRSRGSGPITQCGTGGDPRGARPGGGQLGASWGELMLARWGGVEPRRLASLGLARTTKERIGGRSRNRYEITDEGRQALRAWLARPSSAPRLEFEPMLRVAFADQGEIDDLLAAIATLRDWAANDLAVAHEMVQAYRDGQAPFPNRKLST
jgi:hypothetical protein